MTLIVFCPIQEKIILSFGRRLQALMMSARDCNTRTGLAMVGVKIVVATCLAFIVVSLENNYSDLKPLFQSLRVLIPLC